MSAKGAKAREAGDWERRHLADEFNRGTGQRDAGAPRFTPSFLPLLAPFARHSPVFRLRIIPVQHTSDAAEHGAFLASATTSLGCGGHDATGETAEGK